jgi:ribonuclease D
MIQTPEELERLLPAVRSAEWVGIDTEADSLHSYPEKLCLIQLSLPATDVLVDPLAGCDLSPLWEALQGRGIILHGGDYDLRLLQRSQDFVPDRIFDTLSAARLLGRHEFGLHHLVKEFLGIAMAKGSQKANWSIRPLTHRMTEYALADARFLRPLADCLRYRLKALGRLEWHAQICQDLLESNTRAAEPKARPAWQIKGAARLAPRALAVLRSVWHWREKEAIAANRPPFFILDHDRLLHIASLAAMNDGFVDLIPRRYSQPRRRSLILAIEEGMGTPQSDLPRVYRERGERMSERQKRRFEELREHRDQAARELGLDPSFVASKSTLSALALGHDPDEHILPWQAALLFGPSGSQT